MALTRDQSLQLYGTDRYTAWGEVEATADAKAKGLSGGGGSGGFNFEAEVDNAFNELGAYYDFILNEAKGDMNRALARLEEDYNTGKRQRMASFSLTKEAQTLAQDAFATDAQKAYKTLADRNLARGISRTSAFAPTEGRGIADEEEALLKSDVERGQKRLALGEKSSQLEFDQSGELMDTSFGRVREDVPREFERFSKEQEEQRKRDAGELALSRQQRAYQRFEADLI